MRKLVFSFLTVAVVSASAWAQMMQSSDVVEFAAVPGQDVYKPGESFHLLFSVKIRDGWHVQSHNPTMDSLVATSVSLPSTGEVSFGKVSYPSPVMEKFEFMDKPLATYKGDFYIGVTGAVSADAGPSLRSTQAVLSVQACNKNSCIQPSEITARVPVLVPNPGVIANPLNGGIYADNSILFSGPSSGDGGDNNRIRDYFESKGFLLTLVFVFLGGLALNLTPCVYPLIPITISYFGGQGASGKSGLVVNAVMYIGGMAVMYSALGVTAALTGNLFGALLQHWAVILLIVAALVALAISMFGLYEIRMPALLADIGGKNRNGLVGAFLMGLTAGIIAAPCIGPFVLGLLTFVGEKADPVTGFAMFFTLALGLGAPFLFLAIFSGSITMLPRSGVWMIWIRQLFGFVLLGMALYFAGPLIPAGVYPVTLGLLIISAGVYLGWISGVKGSGYGFTTVKWTTGAVALAGGLFVIAGARQAPAGPMIQWEKATVSALESARLSGRPVIVDFTADWCLPCKELEHYTFSDTRVARLSKKFTTLRANLTSAGDPDADAMKKRFDVSGVPTLVFISPDGKERVDLRFVGFVEAGEFLAKMNNLENVIKTDALAGAGRKSGM